jgi:hypothetical protein
MADMVECYSSARYAERPVAFVYEGQRLKVERILNRRRLPGGISFTVLTQDRAFELYYDELEDQWSISLTSGQQGDDLNE